MKTEKRFKEQGVFENPLNLSSSIVVPTGKVSSCTNAVTVEVWKDNKIVNIKVNTDETYPAVVCDGKLSNEYALKICAAIETEESGVYYLKSIGFAEDEKGNYIGVNKTNPKLLDETELTSENMFFVKSEVKPVSPFRTVVRYFQNASNKVPVPTKSYFLGDFSFGQYDFDITNWAGTRRNFMAGKTAFAQDFSKVLVKYNFADKDPEWVVYDSNTLPLMTDIDFKELSYVVSNNVTNGPEDESCMKGEDLVFLFGEVDVPDAKELSLSLGKETEADADASLYQVLRMRVKIDGELSQDDAKLTYTRNDGAVCEYIFKLALAGVDTEGYYVFDFRMREVQTWQNVIKSINVEFPEGDYEVDYAKLLATGYSSDVKLGKALPMFSDGNYKKGFFIGTMEKGLTPLDTYFATTEDGDKKREEYEASVKDDESNPKKMYPDWRIDPLYVYDYINTCPLMKEAGFTYDSNPTDRLDYIKEKYPEEYQKYYLDYEFRDTGKPTEEGFYVTADKAGSKIVVYKPDQVFTTTDGVERHGDVLSFTLNGSKLFYGKPYDKYDKNNNPDGTWRFWPHLLIQQNTGTKPVDFEKEIQYSTGADRIFCEFDIRLVRYSENYTKKTHADGQVFDNGHMSFLMYSYLRPKKQPGTLVWFGLNVAHDSPHFSQNYGTMWCRDSGANTYMYGTPPEVVYSGFGNSIHSAIQKVRKAEGYVKGTPVTTDWIHVKVDLTHHISVILDRVNAEDAYGLGVTTRDDWFFNGVNIGFETADNVDCTFEMANFNYYSYNIEE